MAAGGGATADFEIDPRTLMDLVRGFGEPIFGDRGRSGEATIVK